MGANPSAVKYVATTFSGDVTLMEDWLMDRIDWLDSNMIGTDCNLSTPKDNPFGVDIIVYPNPTAGICTIETSVEIDRVQIRSNTGQLVALIDINNRLMDGQEITLDLQALSDGIYSLEFLSSGFQIVRKIAIVH
jgi:hypothetical protein